MSRRVLFAAAAGLFALPLILAYLPSTRALIGPHDGEERAVMSAAQRALGPLAPVAASIEWVRYRNTLVTGDTARAYAIAERALALDSRSERGWLDYAQHLIFERGSFLENTTPEARRLWIQAGLDVLARGEAASAHPGEIAFIAGMIRIGWLADLPDGDLGWPGGPAALLEQGRRDLERARAAGRTGVDEVLDRLNDASSPR